MGSWEYDQREQDLLRTIYETSLSGNADEQFHAYKRQRLVLSRLKGRRGSYIRVFVLISVLPNMDERRMESFGGEFSNTLRKNKRIKELSVDISIDNVRSYLICIFKTQKFQNYQEVFFEIERTSIELRRQNVRFEFQSFFELDRDTRYESDDGPIIRDVMENEQKN